MVFSNDLDVKKYSVPETIRKVSGRLSGRRRFTHCEILGWIQGVVWTSMCGHFDGACYIASKSCWKIFRICPEAIRKLSGSYPEAVFAILSRGTSFLDCILKNVALVGLADVTPRYPILNFFASTFALEKASRSGSYPEGYPEASANVRKTARGFL